MANLKKETVETTENVKKENTKTTKVSKEKLEDLDIIDLVSYETACRQRCAFYEQSVRIDNADYNESDNVVKYNFFDKLDRKILSALEIKLEKLNEQYE